MLYSPVFTGLTPSWTTSFHFFSWASGPWDHASDSTLQTFCKFCEVGWWSTWCWVRRPTYLVYLIISYRPRKPIPWVQYFDCRWSSAYRTHEPMGVTAVKRENESWISIIEAISKCLHKYFVSVYVKRNSCYLEWLGSYFPISVLERIVFFRSWKYVVQRKVGIKKCYASAVYGLRKLDIQVGNVYVDQIRVQPSRGWQSAQILLTYYVGVIPPCLLYTIFLLLQPQLG